MENFFVKPDEINDLIKKRFELSENDGEKMNIDNIPIEDINNFIIKKETERFNDLFNKVFEENILPTEEEVEKNFDSEDGPINEICLEIIKKIKNNIEKLDKTKLLNFIFKIIKYLILKREEEEEEEEE